MTIFWFRAETLGDEFDLRAATEAAGIEIHEWNDDDWVDEDDDKNEWDDGYNEVVDIDYVTAAEIHEPLTVELFCLSRHPGGGVRCRRMRGHDGDHSAYRWHINQPETWTAGAQ